MRGFTQVAASAAAVLIGLTLLAAPARPAGDSAIKNLMGDNFQNIQIILSNLITARYDKLAPQIKTIHEHALELSKKPPATVKTETERRTFVTYAYQLESNTANMMTVMDVLIQHDKSPTEPGKLNIDYLRVVAAGQFGQVVTTCVLCHNQFRRYTVK